MSKRGVGFGFCAVAAFLFATRYLTAAVYGSNMQGWSSENYNALLEYVGPLPWLLAGVALVIGVAYLAWAEAEQRAR